jgi:hypothetical protein
MLIIDTANIRAHYGRGPGRHWFDPDTLRFFQTRIGETAYSAGSVAFFVTSEQPPGGRRAYTVHRYDFDTRAISTVDTFMGYASRNGAHAAAQCKAAALPAESTVASPATKPPSAAKPGTGPQRHRRAGAPHIRAGDAMLMRLDAKLIHAPATDAGNGSMRASGRTAWSEADYIAACDESARLTGATATEDRDLAPV